MTVGFNKLREVFLEAVEQHAPEAWPEFLDRACGGDSELRAEVELLLQAHVQSERVAPSPPADWLGRTIGPYRLVEQIGEGGMGTVYMAEQSEPIQRRVAIKIIKPGLDSQMVIARFEAERQLLALMDHPNIARVLDAGATQSGEPYFVMELIRGIPITKYCDERRLGPRERLELLIPVCRAIQHAHQKGIIHRDLKPSNVLIALYDGRPVPKVIDFGVAKAISQPLMDLKATTGFGAVIGTLEYMSPEQAELNQLDVDARSDIYGLGVLLYELLTGTTPLQREQIRRVANLEILRLIREESPPPPSTRISTTEERASIAANRGLEPAKLSGVVRGDLDWIVMRCLEKDRARRYESADGLARELERYLAEEPVEACPPTATYRLSKFARRHRAGLTTAAAVAVLIVAGGVTATWLAIRARKAEAVAREQAAVAQAINAFVQNDLLASTNPDMSSDRDLKLRTVLERAAKRAEAAFQGRPLVEAGLDRTMGVAFSSLGEYPAAESLLARAASLYARARGPRSMDALTAGNDLADVYFREGRLEEARRVLEANFAALRATAGPADSTTLESAIRLSNVLVTQGHMEEGLKLIEGQLPIMRRSLGEDHPLTLSGMQQLIRVYWGMGRFDEARGLEEQVLPILRRKLGPEHPQTLVAMRNLAIALNTQRHYEDARKLLQEVLAVQMKTLGPEHPSTLSTIYNLANVERNSGQYAEARAHFQQVLDVQRRVLGNHHTDTMTSMFGLGLTLERLGEREEARRLYREALASQRSALGAEHPLTLRTMDALATLELNAGRYAVALDLYERSLAGRRRTMGADHPAVLSGVNNIAWLLATCPDPAFRDPARAASLAKDVLARNPDNPEIWNTLGVAEYARGAWASADSALRQSVERGRGGDAHDFYVLGMADWQLGRKGEAREWYRKGVESQAKERPTDPAIPRFRAEAERLLGITP